MLLAILATCSPEELEMEEDDDGLPVDLALPPSEIAARRQQIKNKILAVGKMQRVFQLLRCVSRASAFIIGDTGFMSCAPESAIDVLNLYIYLYFLFVLSSIAHATPTERKPKMPPSCRPFPSKTREAPTCLPPTAPKCDTTFAVLQTRPSISPRRVFL